ncbi:uncharacterized protein LOC144715557 [Wolffia australiana]
MDFLKLYQDEDCPADTSSEHYSSDSPITPDLLEEQPIPPRIGDEYQVTLPPLERRLWHTDTEFPLYMGLEVPVTWAVKRDGVTKTCISSSALSTYKCEPNGTNFQAIPDLPTSTWTCDEENIFLLGLYIFEKNLVQVKRFMDCKRMGEILSFYYGKFYRSDAHRRWADSRKVRTRRHIHGQRIFSGWRHNELLQRLDFNLSVESRSTLVEATRSLSECRLSLEEYVFALKATVGLKALVNAVGIGVENYDLTAIPSDPVKASHGLSTRAEIPIGKACSSLTPGDIIKFLTGDFRLSKTKSNDLFWEAVWPRLLAKGWHSEQPKDSTTPFASTTSRPAPLVFLLPAVKKFSRKLIKGKHYFDSVTDVLNKVVSNPRLLELEEREGAILVNPELMKFTVVDTSLVNAGLRQLRSLPVDASEAECRSSQSDDGSETSSSSSSEHEKPKPEPAAKRSCPNGFKPKKCKPKYLSPVLKRQRLTACRNPESVFLALASSEKEAEPRTPLIDLNLPEFPPDFDSCETVEKQPLWEEPAEVSARRQSTRNRPLTARALEALASGFLATRRKGKGSGRVPGRGSARASANSSLVQVLDGEEEYSSQCGQRGEDYSSQC